MKKIDISSKKFPNAYALIDGEDFEKVYDYGKWQYDNGYAVITKKSEKKQKKVYMHRFIMSHILKIRGKSIDHINGNGLDNSKKNLRVCSQQENTQNGRLRKNNKSGFKGVSFCYKTNKWQVSIRANGKSINGGRFFCLIKAAKKYDKLAQRYFGSYAKTNFQMGLL